MTDGIAELAETIRRQFAKEFTRCLVECEVVHTPDKCSMKFTRASGWLKVWVSDWLLDAPPEVVEGAVRRTACYIRCEPMPQEPALDAWMEENRHRWKK